jgi:hypothetical protein
MTMQTFLLILALGLCALISYDLTNTIRSGKARGRTGIVERATRPDAFRRYIVGEAIGLALCVAIALWAIAWRSNG